MQLKGRTELKVIKKNSLFCLNIKFLNQGKGIVETYWLIGPKADYRSAIDQDLFRNEDTHSAVGQHQASMYEKKPFMDGNQSEDRISPVKRMSNSINRRPSIVGGQCPFSAQREGADS